MGKIMRLCVWEPKDGYILDLLVKNKKNVPFCNDIVKAVNKAEKLAEKKGHRVCFWVPEDSRDIVGSTTHVACLGEVFEAINNNYGIDALNVVCADKTWGKIHMLEMVKTDTIQ